jgi:hypothetical protein
MMNCLRGLLKINNEYRFSKDGETGYCTIGLGIRFSFDSIDYKHIRKRKWYPSIQGCNGEVYVIDSKGYSLHRYIMDVSKGYEIDHIDLNPLNNTRTNLRICTHQQNQCNQALQCNNTLGVTGVSFYAPRQKYRARIKSNQKCIHLGYYESIIEATQARHVGMECMFGEYGYYNKIPPTPIWIKQKVIKICKRFVDYSICEAFIISTLKMEGLNV